MARDLRVCFLGDSFVQGTSCDAGLGWVGQVYAEARRIPGLDLTMFNLGIRGQSGPEIAERAIAELSPRLIDKGQAQAVVLAFAANDIRLEVALEDSLAAAREMLSWVKAQGFTPFFVGPPPSADPEKDKGRRALAVELYKVCDDLEAPRLDVQAEVADWSLWFDECAAGDGAHPNTAGYGLIADAFKAWAPWRAWLAQG